MTKTYYDSDDLIDRLSNVAFRKDRSVTFLVGSPLTAPDHLGGHGVPGISGMIDLIRRELSGSAAHTELDHRLCGSPANRYQQAFAFLHGRRGQDAVKRVVRTAVWHAIDIKSWPPHLPQTLPENADSDVCIALEKEPSAWASPSSVDHFGDLLVTCSDTFGGSVLTTNFDPLIEISISKHGGRSYRTVLHDDGNLSQTVAEGTHIVHLHGYWHDYDSLHTPQQLLQQRPQLRRSLERVVEQSILVAIGYSGWDDVITRALMEILSDSTSNPEVMWAFHDADEDAIEESYRNLLSILQPGIGRGTVSLYRGIDCRSTLSATLEQIKPSYPDRSGAIIGQELTALVTEGRRSGAPGRKVRIELDFSVPQQASSDSDRPLVVSPWVGRADELTMLESSTAPIAFITGIGGQGKSALAGQFLQAQSSADPKRFEFWDWRDCREERDRLGTQILRLVERLSDGAIDASQIEVSDIRAIIGVLFHVLDDRRALLVFDNVDQYIDLETLEPVKGLDVLLSEAQVRSHRSCFLFTCRLDLRIDEARALKVALSGLSKNETGDLIRARRSLEDESHLAQELHEATEGHPLWINLIIMQALQRPDGLHGAIDLIKQGGATLPDTTRTIWRMLNDQQRDVLRTMAELDRPEPWNQLLSMLPGVNANRVDRALRSLRSFHLIETRTQPGGEPLVGLHPIIREFVRTSFPRQEREQYVGKILDFLDRMIDRFKGLLSQDPSYDILEHWIRKADLQITFAHYGKATSTIAEISLPLVNRGYAEEMVRLSLRLLNECDWAEACASYREFDVLCFRCVKLMIETGHDEVKTLLQKYEEANANKSAQFIMLCDLRCYAHWYAGEYEESIRWGEEGERLRERTSVDTAYSTKHNLALARRDSGRIDEAIRSFLEGESLDRVVTPGVRIEGRGAPYYGNIGRCLFFDNRMGEALSCYVKSAQLLEEDRSASARLNKGYIRLWIADLVAQQGELELAAVSYRAAICMWSESSPPRAADAERKLMEFVAEQSSLSTYVDAPEWRVEGVFVRWLDKQS